MAELDGDLLMLLVIGFAGGLYLVYEGFKLRRQRRLMEDTPTSTIQSVSIGPVEVKGDAVADTAPFPSPVTGTECLAAKYKVESWDSDDNEWDEIDSGVEGDPFYVEDDTGRILVNPADATLDISDANTEQTKVRPSGDPPEPIEQFVERNSNVGDQTSTLNLGITSVETGRKRRYTEKIIVPDEDVYVFGTASRRQKDDVAADALVIEDGERDMFFISDKDEDTLTSQRKWALLWRVPVGAALSAGCLGTLLWLFGVL